MLRSMRSSVGSIFAKLILGLLVLSFVGWGVADYTTGGRTANVAATVGDVEIPIQQLSVAYRQEITRQQLDQTDVETLRQLGVADRALQGLVTRALYAAEIDALNVTAGDAAVRRSIESRPEFQNQFQQFDRQLFERTVAYSGLSEAGFVDSVRREVARDYLISAVASGATAPASLTNAVLKYSGERRNVSAISIPKVPAAEIDPPDDATLQTFFDENIEDYRKPEYRTISYILISPEELAADVTPDEAAVREAYDARLGEFSSPEFRHVQQLILPDEETVAKMAAAMATGKSFAQAAQETAGVDEAALDLGRLTRQEIPDAALAEAAFSLPEGGVSDPIDGAFGRFIVHVTKIESGTTSPLEDVRDRIEADLKLDTAIDTSYELSKQLDDALGEGFGIEEAGERIGVPARRIAAVDRSGAGQDGVALTGLPSGRAFLENAFDARIGEDSFVTETDTNGFFVLRVDDVIESRLPTLDEVKTEVAADWIETRRDDATLARADALVERAENAADFAAFAEAEGLVLISVTNMDRGGRGEANRALPRQLAGEIFSLRPGEVVSASGPSGAFVARLDEIVPASEALDARTREQMAARLDFGMTSDLIEQMSFALQARHDIDVNPAAVERVIDPTAYGQSTN